MAQERGTVGLASACIFCLQSAPVSRRLLHAQVQHINEVLQAWSHPDSGVHCVVVRGAGGKVCSITEHKFSCAVMRNIIIPFKSYLQLFDSKRHR